MSNMVSIDELKDARDFADVIWRVNGRRASTSELVNELRIHNQETDTRSQDTCGSQENLPQAPKPLQPQVEDERLTSINKNFLSELLTEEQALIQVKKLVDELKSEAGLSRERANIRNEILKANKKVFEKLWEQHYIGRDIVSPETAEREFLVALKAIDSLPLASASKIALQKKVDEKFNEIQHKRYTGRIIGLLKFLGRPFILHRKRRPHQDVKFVTFAEFQKVLDRIEASELKALYLTLFGTGMRLGEAFTINGLSLKKKWNDLRR